MEQTAFTYLNAPETGARLAPEHPRPLPGSPLAALCRSLLGAVAVLVVGLADGALAANWIRASVNSDQPIWGMRNGLKDGPICSLDLFRGHRGSDSRSTPFPAHPTAAHRHERRCTHRSHTDERARRPPGKGWRAFGRTGATARYAPELSLTSARPSCVLTRHVQ